MVKQNISNITFMMINITNIFWWWVHVQCFEDGKVCKNSNYYFIWKCVLWHPKDYSHFLFLFCACVGVLMNFQQWLHMGIISLWEEGFHSIMEKGCMEITESYRSISHCLKALWPMEMETRTWICLQILQASRNPNDEKQMQKVYKSSGCLKKKNKFLKPFCFHD